MVVKLLLLKYENYSYNKLLLKSEKWYSLNWILSDSRY